MSSDWVSGDGQYCYQVILSPNFWDMTKNSFAYLRELPFEGQYIIFYKPDYNIGANTFIAGNITIVIGYYDVFRSVFY